MTAQSPYGKESPATKDEFRMPSLKETVIIIVVILVLAAILYPVFAKAPIHGHKPSAFSQTKQIATAMHIYAGDYNDKLPIAGLWQDQIFPYHKNPDLLILEKRTGFSPEASFAMNERVSQFNYLAVRAPWTCPLVFSSRATNPNASGGPASVAYSEKGFAFLARIDTSTRIAKPEEVANLEWHPTLLGSSTLDEAE
jgi:hypothetical protein